jgi:hypothetical protein
MKKTVKVTQKSLKKLKAKAWKLFSSYIRQRDKGICFTCGVQKHWKEMHAGHFKHGRLDFDPMNVNCQCAYCNTYNHGNLGEYGVRLVKKYGLRRVQDLILRANTHIGYTIEELEALIEKYKEFK